MSTLISGDPRQRRVFTYQEPNWGTEHNRNWTETVEQINLHEADLTDHEARISANEALLTSHATTLSQHTSDIADRVTYTDLHGLLVEMALCSVAVSASAGSTSIQVSATAAPVKAGEKLMVVSADLQVTEVEISSDAAAGVTSLSVVALPAALAAGSAVLYSTGSLRDTVAVLRAEMLVLEGRTSDLETRADGVDAQITTMLSDIADLDNRVTQAETNLNVYSQTLSSINSSVTTLTTSLTTESGRIDALVADMTTVQNDLASLDTTVTSLSSSLSLKADAAELTSLSTRLSEAESVTSVGALSSGVVGTVSSLPVDSLLVDLDSGVQLVVIDTDTGSRYAVTTSAPVSKGSTSIPIVSDTVYASNGSRIHMTTETLIGTIRTTADEVLLSLQTSNDVLSVTRTTSSLSGTITSVPVEALTAEIRSGTVLRLVDRDSGISTQITLTSDVPAGSTTLTINSVTLPTTFAAQSWVRITDTAALSQIQLLQDEINLRVEKANLVSELSLGLGSIDVTTGILKSSNWDGQTVVDGQGKISISSAGTTGWALAEDGSGAFQDVEVSGVINMTGGSVLGTIDVMDDLRIRKSIGGSTYTTVTLGTDVRSEIINGETVQMDGLYLDANNYMVRGVNAAGTFYSRFRIGDNEFYSEWNGKSFRLRNPRAFTGTTNGPAYLLEPPISATKSDPDNWWAIQHTNANEVHFVFNTNPDVQTVTSFKVKETGMEVVGGYVILKNLPTTAPAESGRLWVDTANGNVLKIVP